MSINIKTTNISTHGDVEAYLIKKLDSLNRLVDFNADNVVAQAEVAKTTNHHKSGDIFRAEINVRIGKDTFRVVSEKDDIYAAIDDMKDELSREITKEKDRYVSDVRRDGAEFKNAIRNQDHEQG